MKSLIYSHWLLLREHISARLMPLLFVSAISDLNLHLTFLALSPSSFRFFVNLNNYGAYSFILDLMDFCLRPGIENITTAYQLYLKNRFVKWNLAKSIPVDDGFATSDITKEMMLQAQIKATCHASNITGFQPKVCGFNPSQCLSTVLLGSPLLVETIFLKMLHLGVLLVNKAKTNG